MAPRIFQRRLDGVPPVENHRSVAVAWSAAPRRGLGFSGALAVEGFAVGRFAGWLALFAVLGPGGMRFAKLRFARARLAGVTAVGVAVAHAGCCVTTRRPWQFLARAAFA